MIKRIIVLPASLKDTLKEIANKYNECAGALFYLPRKYEHAVVCPLSHILILKEGTPGAVTLDYYDIKKIEKILNNTRLNYILFHTHSTGTIEKYGAYYGTNFSEQDKQIINRFLRTRRDHISMLVTPYNGLYVKFYYDSAYSDLELKIVNWDPYEKDKVAEAIEVILSN